MGYFRYVTLAFPLEALVRFSPTFVIEKSMLCIQADARSRARDVFGTGTASACRLMQMQETKQNQTQERKQSNSKSTVHDVIWRTAKSEEGA